MQLFLTVKNFFKHKFSGLYQRIRYVLFPLYLNWYNFKIKKFKKPIFYKFYYKGIKYKIKLDPSNGFIDQAIYANGVYEEDVLDFIKDNLAKGDVFVDIGANIGDHTLFASRVVGVDGQVVAFEPISKLIKQIRESLDANQISNVTLHSYALGDRNSTEKIYIRDNNIGGSSITPFIEKGEGEIIETKIGDELMQDLIRIDMMKIDVEGYEPEVFVGLKDTILNKRPIIIFEYSPIFWGKNRKEKAEIIKNVLVKSGYKTVNLDTLEEINWEELARDEDIDQANLVAYP